MLRGGVICLSILSLLLSFDKYERYAVASCHHIDIISVRYLGGIRDQTIKPLQDGEFID